jgi:hypothetical protein
MRPFKPRLSLEALRERNLFRTAVHTYLVANLTYPAFALSNDLLLLLSGIEWVIS